MSKNFFVLILIMAISGCMSQKEIMIEQGYPLSYADGFDDGCHSGKKAGGYLFDEFKKDVRRFNSDRDYAQGWSDAFRQCETEVEASQRMMRMTTEQQKLFEQKRHNRWQEERYLEKQIKLDDATIKYLNSRQK